MSDIKISELPVVPNNTFNTIFPNVQGGETNQIALSGFNTNDFTNVVNLGTGSTASVLTMDCSLGDVFVFTFTGSSSASYTASTTNSIAGKTYYVILQNASSPSSSFGLVDQNNVLTIGNVSVKNRTVIRPFLVINGRQVVYLSSVDEQELPFFLY